MESSVASGPMTNALANNTAAKAGTMRNRRALAKSITSPRARKLPDTMNPLITKNIATAMSPLYIGHPSRMKTSCEPSGLANAKLWP